MTNKKTFTSILSAICVVLVLAICSVLLVACGGEKESISEVSSYQELVSALEGDKDTIKLTDDIVVEDVITVTREVTLDLNGKTLSNESPIWVDTKEIDKWSIISVRANGDLTITGNGKVHALKDDIFAVDVMNGGKLTIQSGKFIGNVHCIYVNQGSAEIKGGEYSIQQVYGADKPYEFVLNLLDENRKNGTASIVVTGGTFEKFNPADCKAEGEGTNFVAEGYTSRLQEGSEDIYEVIVAPQE